MGHRPVNILEVVSRPEVRVSKSAHAGDFFVVGGPVQSDRACYVKRAADERLAQAIADERFAYVLSPRATGKSSLMARTIRRLRSEGQLAAVVDLTQIGSRTEGADAGRWYYSIAYRIVRELRLKVDLQEWWQDRSALLSEQRLVEFFGDIVLANTSAPVNVFIDEADRAIELPFAAELFIAVRSCYMRRVSEPDFTRLNFVVLGAASPELLCPDASLSPFTDGVAIELADFSLDEARRLAPGFDLDTESAVEIIDAIQRWTGGHPYLTQKIARALVRRGGLAADVDATVHELLLAAAKVREEPLLNQMRVDLEGNDKVTRQARGVLGRLAGGTAMPGDLGGAGRALLDRIGMLRRRPDGTLGYRNAIFHSVFNAGLLKSSAAMDWRRPVAAAAAALLVLALPYWYFRVLPQPYIATLTVVSQDLAVAEEAHRRLRQLPGFGARADRLLTDALVRRSERSATLDEVMAADRLLRSLPEREPVADRMLASFWLRSATARMHVGDRDAALIYALAAERGRPEAARSLAAELIDSDYPYLEATFRTVARPTSWEVDWMHDRLVLIDESRRIRHLALGARGSNQAVSPSRVPGRLTAVQHVEVERELTVDADGTAGAFTLLVTTQHERAGDLMFRLTAPSGVSVTLEVSGLPEDRQPLTFNAGAGSPLAMLSGEAVRGQWLLTVVDRQSGAQGMLTSWGLSFPDAEHVWEDVPEPGVPLPDPVRTEQVETSLAAGGAAAVAVPSRSGVAGALSVWDLVDGGLRADIGVTTAPDTIRLIDGGARLATVTGSTATLWDVDRQSVLFELDAPDGFAVPPAVSPDQRFVAFAVRRDVTTSEITLVESATGKVLGTAALSGPVRDWVLAAGGRYVAVLDGSRWVRFFDAASGEVLGEAMYERRLDRLAPLTRAELVVAIDVESAVVAWPVGLEANGLDVGEAMYLGTTVEPDAVNVAERARRVAFTGTDNRVEVRELSNGGLAGRSLRADGARRMRMSAAGDEIVVEGEGLLRRWHIGDGALAGSPALDLSAVAVDPVSAEAALGYRAGHLRIRDTGRLADGDLADPRVDYIGHRGGVASIDLARGSGIAASGGTDGVVRIWDLASVAPNEYFLRHPEGPIRALAISPDGRYVASAAEYSARIWRVQSGELVSEVPVDGTATAVAFAPASTLVAVGDTAGNLFLGAPQGTSTLRSARMPAAVTTIAFADDRSLMVTGDQTGNLVLWDVAATELPLARAAFAEPVRWAVFDGSEDALLVATDNWVHALERSAASIRIVATRMLSSEFAGIAAFGRTGPRTVQIVSASMRGGGPVTRELSLAGALPPLSPAADPLLLRPWSTILDLKLDTETGRVHASAR